MFLWSTEPLARRSRQHCGGRGWLAEGKGLNLAPSGLGAWVQGCTWGTPSVIICSECGESRGDLVRVSAQCQVPSGYVKWYLHLVLRLNGISIKSYVLM